MVPNRFHLLESDISVSDLYRGVSDLYIFKEAYTLIYFLKSTRLDNGGFIIYTVVLSSFTIRTSGVTEPDLDVLYTPLSFFI